jgi:hypothetical protein
MHALGFNLYPNAFDDCLLLSVGVFNGSSNKNFFISRFRYSRELHQAFCIADLYKVEKYPKINTIFFCFYPEFKIWGCEQEELRSSEQREDGGDIQGKSQHHFYYTLVVVNCVVDPDPFLSHIFVVLNCFVDVSEPDPHQIEFRSASGSASNKNQDPDSHQFADDSQNVWNMTLFEHFFQGFESSFGS